MKSRSRETRTSAVYTFKVALKGDTSIWRRIQVRGDQTLDEFHEAIYEAFDRDDEHLYSFYFPPPGSRGQARIRDAVQHTHPDFFEYGDGWDDTQRHAAAVSLIDSLQLRRGRKFEYLFDFGDSWWHEITVEQIDGVPEKVRYPRIIEKHGESPPQYPDPDEEWSEGRR